MIIALTRVPSDEKKRNKQFVGVQDMHYGRASILLPIPPRPCPAFSLGNIRLAFYPLMIRTMERRESGQDIGIPFDCTQTLYYTNTALEYSVLHTRQLRELFP